MTSFRTKRTRGVVRRTIRSRAASGALATALSVALVAGFVATSAADDLDDRRNAAERRAQQVEEDAERLNSELEGTNAELAQATVDLQAIEARLPVAQAELAKAQAEVKRTKRQADVLAKRLADAHAEEAKVSAEVDKGAAEAAAAKSTIAQMARLAYRGDGGVSGLGIVTGAQSTQEFVEEFSISSTAARNQARALDELQQAESLARNREARLVAVRQTVTELKAQADANLAAARKASQAAADRKAEVEKLVADQQAKKATIAANQAQAQAAVDQNEADHASLKAEIKALIAQQSVRDRKAAEARAKAEQEARARQNAAKGTGSGSANGSGSGSGAATRTVPKAGNGFLSYPTANPFVTSSYGMRMHPILHYVRLHAGTDFRAGCGTPIMAAAGGTVAVARTMANGTNEIVVDHGWVDGASLMTGYLHLSRFAVSKGQSVSRGQVIGYSGNTGLSTACHLHFEVYVNGDTVNPMSKF